MRIKRFPTRETLLVVFVVFIGAAEFWTSRWVNVTTEGETALLEHSTDVLLLPDPLWQLQPSNTKEIRRWGCNRTETPLIFVHIGKSGGGVVGSRIEASSLNYTKKKPRQVDASYFPLEGGKKARFISSSFATHLPNREKTYEGTSPCHASTPLGQAIGCPETLQRIRSKQEERRRGECNEDSVTCHVVYMSHNFFGSEMHWLPIQYLKNWWSSRWREATTITPLWDRLLPGHTWCSSKNMSRPVSSKQYVQDYEECSIPLQREVDTKAIHALTKQLSTDDSHVITSWSPLYASLPVLRVTVMRDPFTWLVSKYFWHRKEQDIENNSTCDNVEEGILRNSGLPRPSELDMDNSGPGWISRMSLGYIMYLCGEDCIVRYAAGTATLKDVELQAEDNLRQAFAVVGILEETNTFYEMLGARVQYIDTSLNPHVKGYRHSTGRNAEIIHCRDRFQDPSFRTKLLNMSPELRIINRLYEVAKEVNQFQLQDLRECSSPGKV